MIQRGVVFGRGLVGVLTLPEQNEGTLPTILLLNAGMTHRVGPHRLYVRLAARLTDLGFPVLRFDFSGIGDSATSESTEPLSERSLRETSAAMDFASDQYGATRFIPMGICSGADVGFSLAIHRPQVVGAVLINGGFAPADVDPELLHAAQKRIRARYYKGRVFDPESWSKLLGLKSDFGAIRETLLGVLKRRSIAADSAQPSQETSNSDSDVQQLNHRGVKLLGIYSEGSFSWDLLQLLHGPRAERLREFENTQIEFVASADHIFTPLWAQARLLDVIFSWSSEMKMRLADVSP